jgi:iron complex outermembrane receptor protein
MGFKGAALVSTALVLSLVAMASDASAQAQAAPTPPEGGAEAVEEVIVTARRRNERLQDIPVAGTAINTQTIQDQGGVRDLRSILDNAPGVNYNDVGYSVNSEPTIRGAGGGRGAASNTGEPGVGLFRDGVFVPGGAIGGKTFTRMDLFDLERVEVLRGPQGALYGRDAVGGAINAITRRPQFDREGYVRAQYGSFERAELEGVVNEQIIADVLALRVGVEINDQNGGYLDNPFNGRILDTDAYGGARAALRLKRGRLDATLTADYFARESPGVFSALEKIPNAIQNRDDIPLNARTGVLQQAATVTLQATYDLGFATLSSVTGWRTRNTTLFTDEDGFTPAQCPAIRAFTGSQNCQAGVAGKRPDETDRVFTSAHLTGGADALTWLVGGEYTVVDYDFRVIRRGGPNSTDQIAIGENTSYAVYGSVGYDLTEKLNLTGELRYTAEQKDFSAQTNNVSNTGVITVVRPVASSSESDNISYTAAATYKFTPDFMVYARSGTAYRAGGFNTDPGTPATDPRPITIPYDDEETSSQEIGSKLRFGRWGTAAVAIFRSETDGVLIADTNGLPIAPVTFLRNGGTSEVSGFELEGTARKRLAGGMLRLSAGYAQAEGEITAGTDKGRIINRIPERSYNGNVNYRRLWSPGNAWFVNLNVKAERGGFQDIQNTFRLNPFTRVNARAGVDLSDWRLVVFSQNVTDERYAVFEGPSARRYNSPRTVGVEVSKRW